MAATKFTPEMRGALIAGFAAGCSLPDASKAAGINPTTVKTWLARGRKTETGDYAEFAAKVAQARESAANREEPMDEDELRLVVSSSAKKGNVQAQKLYWEMIRAADPAEEPEAPADPLEALDELAARRPAAAAA